MSKGKLILGSSHLGNPNFISLGMKNAIEEADVIIVEDISIFNDMVNLLGASPKAPAVDLFFGLNTHEEIGDFKEYCLRELESEKTVLIVPLAGQAGIADPAVDVSKECIKRCIRIEVIPGPSLPNIAYLNSGFGDGSYSFEAQLQPEPGVFGYLQEIIKQHKCAIFIEPSEQDGGLAYFLKTVIPFYGKTRKACIMIDLTMNTQKLHRGTLWELWTMVRDGEIAPHVGRSIIVVDGSSGWHHSEGLQQPTRPADIEKVEPKD